MGNLVVAAGLTLDGVMQAPGGPGEDDDGGFPFGGWMFPFADEKMEQIAKTMLSGADAFLLGRRTYEIFAGYWPKVLDSDDVIATSLNSKPKYVASRTLGSVEWNNSTLLEGDVAAAVKRLKAEVDGQIVTQGSSNLIQTLMQHDLVDEYRIWFYPVLLGQGKRLFGDGTIPTRLKLVDTVTTGTGAVMNTYTNDGRPEMGSFALEEQQEQLTKGASG